jgi:hypothetical protein
MPCFRFQRYMAKTAGLCCKHCRLTKVSHAIAVPASRQRTLICPGYDIKLQPHRFLALITSAFDGSLNKQINKHPISAGTVYQRSNDHQLHQLVFYYYEEKQAQPILQSSSLWCYSLCSKIKLLISSIRCCFTARPVSNLGECC